MNDDNPRSLYSLRRPAWSFLARLSLVPVLMLLAIPTAVTAFLLAILLLGPTGCASSGSGDDGGDSSRNQSRSDDLPPPFELPDPNDDPLPPSYDIESAQAPPWMNFEIPDGDDFPPGAKIPGTAIINANAPLPGPAVLPGTDPLPISEPIDGGVDASPVREPLPAEWDRVEQLLNGLAEQVAGRDIRTVVVSRVPVTGFEVRSNGIDWIPGAIERDRDILADRVSNYVRRQLESGLARTSSATVMRNPAVDEAVLPTGTDAEEIRRLEPSDAIVTAELFVTFRPRDTPVTISGQTWEVIAEYEATARMVRVETGTAVWSRTVRWQVGFRATKYAEPD